MKPQSFLVAAPLALVLPFLVSLAGCEGKKTTAAATAMPPPTVLVTPAVRRDLPLFVETVATIDGYVNADIRARVKGYLQSQTYKDGATVKEGQTLFTIETTDYAAAVSIAEANVARTKAVRDKNDVQLDRYKGLLRGGIVSQQDVDNISANAADTSGQVSAAEAELRQARLNLSYTTLKSPISGTAGIALVRVGNLVGQDGPTLLTTVSQIDPIRVNFPISESDYVHFHDRWKNFDNRDLEWAKARFAELDANGQTSTGSPGVELILSDGSVFPHRGVIVTADRQVDPTTGTLQLQALIPNPGAVLRPGQYGRARLRRPGDGKNAIVVPEKALISVQGAYSVAVVGADNKVQMRHVELGSSAPGFRVVNQGLEEGESIVVEGVQKVSEGSPVTPKPAPPPPAETSETATATPAHDAGTPATP